MKRLAGISRGENIIVYEDISAKNVKRLDVDTSFREADLAHGDILVVQRAADDIKYGNSHAALPPKAPQAFPPTRALYNHVRDLWKQR